MRKHFFNHLVETQSLDVELDSLELSSKEKEELLYHVHESIHYTILDIVLSELPEEHKKTFLEHLNLENHEKIWELLHTHTEGIESKIKTASNTLVKAFLDDIQKTRNK